MLPMTDLLVTEAAWGRLPYPRRTSCSGSCSSPSCSGLLSAWIALVVIGCMIKRLWSAVIGIALFLTGGVPVYGMPVEFGDFFGFGTLLGVPVPIWVAAILVVLF